jgi:farnesyl-diphosphate farnesyltransferase
MATEERQLLGPLLRNISRSFYKTLQLLPGRIRKPISLAYLLARTTDTIADTELVPAADRLAALARLRARILGAEPAPLSFASLVHKQGAAAEASLLEQVNPIVALLDTLSAPDRQLVRDVLQTITSGQELDLRRFAETKPGAPTPLQTEEELDDYTFRVAGCVGEFWTHMCRAHIFPRARLDDAWLIEKGIRFGKGLQLVNILRDIPTDLRKGRCYFPAEGLRRVGLQPRDLLDPQNESRFRPLYDDWLERARAHLAAGWEYTTALPWSAVRVRLACALPILIGVETLALLETGPILNPERRIKVSRNHVKRAFRRSILLYPFPAAWKRLAGGTTT